MQGCPVGKSFSLLLSTVGCLQIYSLSFSYANCLYSSLDMIDFPFHHSNLMVRLRVKMSPPPPPPPENEIPIVLGFGCSMVDIMVEVNSFPHPDDKIQSTSLTVQPGGNIGNGLACAARLGVKTRHISKVANDAHGRKILEALEADGVDTSFFVVSEEGNTPFTYIIVDKQTKTRTCVHSQGYPPMIPDDLSKSTLLAALKGAKIVYLDALLHETSLLIAREANRMRIPVLIDAERLGEGLDDLLNLSDYVVCSAKLPQEWTQTSTVQSALVSMMLRLPNLKFVIVTLGEDGCMMLERSQSVEGVQYEEMDVDNLVEHLKKKIDNSTVIPTCISSKVARLQANGGGEVCGRLFLGTAEKIPPLELVDTTGAGDAFIGAVLHGICTNKAPEKMLPFAAQVAAACCRAMGARTGLPHLSDPLLAPLFCSMV